MHVIAKAASNSRRLVSCNHINELVVGAGFTQDPTISSWVWLHVKLWSLAISRS